MKISRKKLVIGLGAAACVLTASVAFAFTAPAAGDFVYDVYDIGVNKLAKGPVGFIGGLGLIVWGLYGGLMGKTGLGGSVMSILGGGVIAKADTVTETLGAML